MNANRTTAGIALRRELATIQDRENHSLIKGMQGPAISTAYNNYNRAIAQSEQRDQRVYDSYAEATVTEEYSGPRESDNAFRVTGPLFVLLCIYLTVFHQWDNFWDFMIWFFQIGVIKGIYGASAIFCRSVDIVYGIWVFCRHL